MVRLDRITLLAQLFVIWLSVEIIVMLTFTRKLPLPITMAVAMLSLYTVSLLAKAMSSEQPRHKP
jgi:hypothetical protein